MINGIEVVLRFTPPAPFTDEWIDSVYSSLEGNMAIKSIDMFVKEDEGEIRFILGVDAFDYCTDEFFISLATDAVEKALDEAAGPNTRKDHARPATTKILVFAE